MDKVQTCLQVLRKRMEDGDLFLKGQMPSERRLTEELGVSRTTVRKALKVLLEEGMLVREGRRKARFSEAAADKKRVPMIAFLAPAGFSSDYGLWWDGVLEAVKGREAMVRPVSYIHLTDPAVHEAITRYDGLFLLTPAQKIPLWLVHKMREARCRIAVLDQDETAAGFLSVRLFPPAAENKLLRYLQKLGHRRIDCVNTQPEDAVIGERIAGWQAFLNANGLQGTLWSCPSERSLSGAYGYVARLLREKRALGTALFCTTGPCAIGAMRAFRESGLEIGADVSVCAVNDEGFGRYLLKSLTALESHPRSHYLRPVIDWMISGGAWEAPLLVQPRSVPLFLGETTGPAPRSHAGRKREARVRV